MEPASNVSADVRSGLNFVESRYTVRIIYSLICFAWVLFIQSAIEHPNQELGRVLLYGRSLVLFATCVLFVVTWSGKKLQGSLPVYFMGTMLVQSLLAAFEPPNETRVYTYVSYFFLLSCFVY